MKISCSFGKDLNNENLYIMNTAHYTLISVHTSKVKKLDNNLDYIDNIKEWDLMIFKTKKEANNFITEHLAWALKPIKVTKKTCKVYGKIQYYSLF